MRNLIKQGLDGFCLAVGGLRCPCAAVACHRRPPSPKLFRRQRLLISRARTMFGSKRREEKEHQSPSLMSGWVVSDYETQQRADSPVSPAAACANDARVTQQSLTAPPAVMQIQRAIEVI